MTTTNEAKGAVDNYLSAEEQAYFENRGSESAEGKFESSIVEPEAGAESSAGDSSTEHESSADADAADRVTNDGREEGFSFEDESDERDESSAGDEKSQGRDYEKAFKVERHKRKELKEQLEATARKTAEMEQAIAHLKASIQQPVEPEAREVIPDPEEDPLGYQQYKINKLEKTQNELNQYLHHQAQLQQKSAQERAFLDTYKSSASEYAKQAPDFQDAYKFLMKARLSEYEAVGYSPAQANELLVEDEMAIVAKAYQDKVNPAKRLYDLAKHRGFGTKTAPNSVKDLDQIQKGMQASKSLKSGGGQLSEGTPGMDSIDGMTFAEFDNLWAGYKNKAKGIR